MKIDDVGVVEERVKVSWQRSINDFPLLASLQHRIEYVVNERAGLIEELVDEGLPPLHIV